METRGCIGVGFSLAGFANDPHIITSQIQHIQHGSFRVEKGCFWKCVGGKGLHDRHSTREARFE
jgi:hypothetical protein